MQDILNKLTNRKTFLQKLIITNLKKQNGTYIKEMNKDIIYKLAQKDYNK